MKGSLWAVVASVTLGAILFSGADLAAQNNTTNASDVVRSVAEPLGGPGVGLGIAALIFFTVGAIALTGGGEW